MSRHGARNLEPDYGHERARPMTGPEALVEARRRWGAAGDAVHVGHPLGYVVGHYFTSPDEPDRIVQVHGMGPSWEDAFAMADEEPCVPLWTPTSAGFHCPHDRFVAAA